MTTAVREPGALQWARPDAGQMAPASSDRLPSGSASSCLKVRPWLAVHTPPRSLDLPDGDLPLLTAGAAQHVSVLRGAQRLHRVRVGHQLLLHRPPLCIHHIDLPLQSPL